jgi:hypothetical protein
MAIQAKFYYTDVLPNSGARLEVGIHEGAEFQGLVKDTDFHEIKFTKDGKAITKRLRRPTAIPKDGESDADALTRSIDANLRHVVKLLLLTEGDKFLDTFEAPDYDAFMAKAVEVLNKHRGFKVNLKVTPDYKESKYAELGYFTDYIEKYEEGKEPTLRFSKKEEERIVIHMSLQKD